MQDQGDKIFKNLNLAVDIGYTLVEALNNGLLKYAENKVDLSIYHRPELDPAPYNEGLFLHVFDL